MINIGFGPWRWPHIEKYDEEWADTVFRLRILFLGPLQIWWSWAD